MEKGIVNYIVDALMAVVSVVCAVSGLVIFFFLPGGVQRGGYQEFLGVIKQDWAVVHNCSGIVLVVLVIIHLVLHFNWIVCMTKSIFSRKKR